MRGKVTVTRDGRVYVGPMKIVNFVGQVHRSGGQWKHNWSDSGRYRLRKEAVKGLLDSHGPKPS